MPVVEYERAGFGGRLQWGQRPAVLVVDFTLAFTDPNCPTGCELSPELSATARLLSVARETNTPILFTSQLFDASHAGSALWRQKGESLAELVAGSRWVEIDPRVEPQSGERVIGKLGASALFETETLALLRTAGADTVLVCGATTSGCVRATVVDLLQVGIPAVVVSDCVGDRSEQQHRASLLDIDAKYGDVTALAEALDYLASRARSNMPTSAPEGPRSRGPQHHAAKSAA
jgi:nicotinamidase-related amidase